jgi:UTP--glucose-1-phosphate uridylyltransferase
MTDDGLRAAEEKMRSEGVADVAIDTFATYWRRLESGEQGLLGDGDIEPVGDLPAVDDLPGDEAAASEALGRAVMIKLNGGLGTSMGMSGPKSLLEVKDRLSFLDIVVRQTLALRRRHDARLPLVLMNSFSTRDATLEALRRYDDFEQDVPVDFLQSKEPKLTADGLAPVTWEADPALEWCPPGHGDIYTALQTSGMLEQLLEAGYRYAFVSNIDNLGAVLDERILAWFAAEEIPFLMEVAERTEADRKGGHLARRAGGDGLVLREIAQTPDEDVDSFQDVSKWTSFNTNSLWIDLEALAALLEARDGVLELPLIVNRKTVDPGDAASPEVVQIETAMGAAIGVFDGARALRVGRDRFAPVKTTNDLLGLRSDAYCLTGEWHVAPNPARRHGSLVVDLDPRYYKLIADFDRRFRGGAPSLLECERFVVRGDVRFGGGVVAYGAVEVSAGDGEPLRIADGAELFD